MKLGDVIQLRCGGPKMVIYDEYGEGTDHRFFAVWFDKEDHPHNMPVPEAAVVTIDEAPPPGGWSVE